MHCTLKDMLKKYLFVALAITALSCLVLLTYNFTDRRQMPPVDHEPVTIHHYETPTTSAHDDKSPEPDNSASAAPHSSSHPADTAPTSEPTVPAGSLPAVSPAPSANTPRLPTSQAVPVQPAPEVQYYTDDDYDGAQVEDNDDADYDD